MCQYIYMTENPVHLQFCVFLKMLNLGFESVIRELGIFNEEKSSIIAKMIRFPTFTLS